jgi:two-component system sensor histidine kinase CreC
VTEVILFGGAAAGLILFVAFVAARLLRARKAGMSIRLQIFVALASIVGAFALGLGVLVVQRVRARATSIAEESARNEASAVAAIVGNEMAAKGRSLKDVASDLAGIEGGLEITLVSPTGEEVLSRGGGNTGRGAVRIDAPILAHGEKVGSVIVVKQTIVIERLLADMTPGILILSVVLGAAAALAAALIGRTIAKPIETLTDFAVRVSEGERRATPPPAQGREVQRLTRALNTMRRELEGRPFVETFAADLSHELKNPVAAIRASAEVLADGALEEPEEAARFVARIQESTKRIETLLGELLGLARMEARGVEEAATVDLLDLAKDVARESKDRGAIVTVDGVHIDVRGDRTWLARLIGNLVENARTHGEEGGAIAVEIGRREGQATLVVRNKGSVAKHVQKRIFRRFVTTRADGGGTGLGLAIVRAIAEAHDGVVECTSFGPPDVTFRVKLPLA